MRVGVTLPFGPPDNLMEAVKTAEDGCASFSVSAGQSGADRSIFAGSLDQVKKDIDDVKKLDANEIFFMIFPDGPMRGFSRGDGTVPQFGVTN
jgi:hypothetical protein